jgi:hypothetical protein
MRPKYTDLRSGVCNLQGRIKLLKIVEIMCTTRKNQIVKNCRNNVHQVQVILALEGTRYDACISVHF